MAAPETKSVLINGRRTPGETRGASGQATRRKCRTGGEMHLARLACERKAKQSAVKQSPLTQFNVGCSGWFYWHWRGAFYPAALPTNQWFEHYAKHFKTVELTHPFYLWPTTAAVKAWVRQTERRKFVFTVKASELITHVKRFNRTKTLVRDFGHIAGLLEPEWDASSSNFHRAFITHVRGSIAFSLSSIHHGGMSSSFGIAAGGENRCLPRFAQQV